MSSCLAMRRTQEHTQARNQQVLDAAQAHTPDFVYGLEEGMALGKASLEAMLSPFIGSFSVAMREFNDMDTTRMRMQGKGAEKIAAMHLGFREGYAYETGAIV